MPVFVVLVTLSNVNTLFPSTPASCSVPFTYHFVVPFGRFTGVHTIVSPVAAALMFLPSPSIFEIILI